DTAAGFIALGRADGIEGKEINIATGTEVSMRQTLETIADIMGEKVDYVVDPARLRPSGSEVFRLCGDNTLITSLTDWRPRYDLEAGLCETVEWFTKPENLAKYKSGIYNV
ncbi:MAG: NAD-dependent dehydratase, partial [Duncaniella dubosii]|nr:NAD-dependent dehydratase [Duncaniella dubosii]